MFTLQVYEDSNSPFQYAGFLLLEILSQTKWFFQLGQLNEFAEGNTVWLKYIDLRVK